jgi:hypothetical protein
MTCDGTDRSQPNGTNLRSPKNVGGAVVTRVRTAGSPVNTPACLLRCADLTLSTTKQSYRTRQFQGNTFLFAAPLNLPPWQSGRAPVSTSGKATIATKVDDSRLIFPAGRNSPDLQAACQTRVRAICLRQPATIAANQGQEVMKLLFRIHLHPTTFA